MNIKVTGQFKPDGNFPIASTEDILGAPIFASSLSSLQNWNAIRNLQIGQLGFASDTGLLYQLITIGTPPSIPHVWKEYQSRVLKNNFAVIDNVYGNDSTGIINNLTNPFKTYDIAATNFSGLSSTNIAKCEISPGYYNTVDTTLIPYVHLFGNGAACTYYLTTNSIQASSSYASGSTTLGISDIHLASNVLIDLAAIGGAGNCSSYFYNSYLIGSILINARNNIAKDSAYFFNSHIWNSVSLDGLNNLIANSNFYSSSLTISATNSSSSSFIQATSLNDLIITGNTAGRPNVVRITNSPIYGSLTLNGAQVTIYIDGSSLSSVTTLTISNGANLYLLDQSKFISNTSPVFGATLDDALDTLKSASANIDGTNYHLLNSSSVSTLDWNEGIITLKPQSSHPGTPVEGMTNVYTQSSINRLQSYLDGTWNNFVQIRSGSSATAGTAVLTGSGSYVVNTTAVTASSIIFLTVQIRSGNAGTVYLSSRVAGTSFTIGAQGGDTSTIGWLIIEPAS
jgi:hypothetical protein